MTNEMWGVKVLTREHSSDKTPTFLNYCKKSNHLLYNEKICKI